jgi:hypothetical protein
MLETYRVPEMDELTGLVFQTLRCKTVRAVLNRQMVQTHNCARKISENRTGGNENVWYTQFFDTVFTLVSLSAMKFLLTVLEMFRQGYTFSGVLAFLPNNRM